MARAELAAVATQLAHEHPSANADVGITLLPLFDQLFGSVRRALLVLLGAVGFVLLGACINVESLSLARAIRREHEWRCAWRSARPAGASYGDCSRRVSCDDLRCAAVSCLRIAALPPCAR